MQDQRVADFCVLRFLFFPIIEIAMPSHFRTRIKVCGITREQDIDMAIALGVDAIGLVFYPHSPRYLSLERANQLVRSLPPFITTVGLFVNATPAQLASTLAQVPLTSLQFHGDETPEECLLAQQKYHLPILRAARMRPELDLRAFAANFIERGGCRGILLDAWVDSYGGAGRAFDWALVPPSWRDGSGPLCTLSGGLNAQNVAQAITLLNPYAVDVSTGVETSPGIKNAARMQEFVAAVRDADLAALSTRTHLR